jgi:hypothetical protein
MSGLNLKIIFMLFITMKMPELHSEIISVVGYGYSNNRHACILLRIFLADLTIEISELHLAMICHHQAGANQL